ncbi:uncharacterized protein LY89DRAFT_756601 [Mollisia scopiformis]|uniref:BTB domain-containing protein n=1 Tax=Mollisia scopiformis TaxID=149040 RepID=A0A194WW99_MOLSC|nr:uncharacterized protein LY89DRAFT_756601 [Mollisia scopiformis]KUJ12246.1 hypothetical protein LY89DRAFT_756601 [Mollisia scopiformis]
MAPNPVKIKPGRDIVHVKVGLGLQDFGIHKNLLCGYSPFFKTAFTSGFEEARSGIMKLPEKDAKMFELFYNWLYTQELWDRDARREEWPELEGLMKLYIFADTVKVPVLKNHIIDTLQAISNATRRLPVSVFPYVWSNTTATDPIRTLMVDWLVWEFNEREFDENPEYFPPELRLQALKAMRRIISTYQRLKEIKDENLLVDMRKYHHKEDNAAQ